MGINVECYGSSYEHLSRRVVSYYCVLAVLLVHKKSKEAVTTSLAPPASRCCIVSRTLAILCARVAQSSVYVLMYTATRSIATHYDRPFYPLGAIVGLSSAVHLLFLIRPLLGRIAWAEAYLHTKWHLDASSRLATIKMGRKLGGLCPLFGEGSWVSIWHNVALTKAPPPCQVPS